MPQKSSENQPQFDLLSGAGAWSFLKEDAEITKWSRLYTDCTWATEYQSPQFLRTWFDVFESRFDPLIVRETDASGDTSGLLFLALSKDQRRLIVAGGGQAEYHGWLSVPGNSHDFIQRAIALAQQNYGRMVRFTNLMRDVPIAALVAHAQTAKQIITNHDSRPLLDVRHRESLEAVLRKKGNKSKMNRLKKLGALEFQRISTIEEFEACIDDIARIFDERQKVHNGVTVFDNPLHRDFPLEYVRRHPDLSRVFTLKLDEKIIGALIGHKCRDALVIDIIAFDLEYQKYSPAKFVIYLAALELNKEEFTYLDLTPGDEWKKQYQSTNEVVFCLDVFPSERAALTSSGIALAKSAAKFALNSLGISRSKAPAA